MHVMNDLAMQKFSDRIAVAAADGTLTPDQARLAKAALEGGGMQAAIEALQASDASKAGNPMVGHGKSHHVAPAGLDEASGNVAECLADLRDALNRDLASDEALVLIQKIADATVGRMKPEVGSQP